MCNVQVRHRLFASKWFYIKRKQNGNRVLNKTRTKIRLDVLWLNFWLPTTARKFLTVCLFVVSWLQKTTFVWYAVCAYFTTAVQDLLNSVNDPYFNRIVTVFFSKCSKTARTDRWFDSSPRIHSETNTENINRLRCAHFTKNRDVSTNVAYPNFWSTVSET